MLSQALSLEMQPGTMGGQLGILAEATLCPLCRCGNVAAILELDEHLNKSFKVRSCCSRQHPSAWIRTVPCSLFRKNN